MLWIAVLGGAIAWAAHLVMSYVVTALSCPRGPLDGPVTALGGPVTVLTGLSVIAALVAAGSAWAAYRIWRSADAPARDRGLALVGLLLNGLFVSAIVFTGTGPLVVPACSS